MNNGSFDITFYNEKGEEIQVIESQQKGGGSSYTKKKEVINETANETITTPIVEDEVTNKTLYIQEIIIPVPEEDNHFWIWFLVLVGIIIFIVAAYFLVRPIYESEIGEIA